MMMRKYIQIILELSKVRITVMVAVTTLTGYILAQGHAGVGIVLPAAGIFLLACGASVLNHLQERGTDAFMKRTRTRPLPSGKVTPGFALWLAVIEAFSGAFILYVSTGITATLLGLTALVWYNGIYTPLKKVTPNAVIPGSVIGSIPPLVGWVAGGGSLWTEHAFIIAVFFFVWQVPHFYLLAVKYSEQYKAAGFPVLTDRFSLKTIKQLIYFWILITTMATLWLTIGEIVSSAVSSVLLILLLVWLNIEFLRLLVSKNVEFRPGKYFMKINYFVLLVVIILSFDHFLA